MAKAFVIAGSPEAKKPDVAAPKPGDFVVAADRGAGHARAWGWPVDLIVGDMDSIAREDVEREVGERTPLVRVPAAKDQTDLELALGFALARNPEALLICGALGGRTDHLLANVLLLTRPDLVGRDVQLADGSETLRVLHGGESGACLELDGQPGSLLSLMAFMGDAEGITTAGLRYPLRGETLYPGEARGVSNVFTGERARIELRSGLLLIVQGSKE